MPSSAASGSGSAKMLEANKRVAGGFVSCGSVVAVGDGGGTAVAGSSVTSICLMDVVAVGGTLVGLGVFVGVVVAVGVLAGASAAKMGERPFAKLSPLPTIKNKPITKNVPTQSSFCLMRFVQVKSSNFEVIDPFCLACAGCDLSS